MHCSKKIEKDVFHISYCSERNQEGLGMTGLLEDIVTENRYNIEEIESDMNVEEIFSENKNFGSEENGEIPNLSSLRFIF